MKQIHDILSGFSNLKEYTEFMQELTEKATSGEEIARGMSKNDKSKQQKANTFLSKEVKKNANGSATEKHYAQAEEAPEPMPEPEAPPVPLQPGEQVNIGRKPVQDEAQTPKTKEVEISGQPDKINTKPQLKRNPNLGL